MQKYLTIFRTTIKEYFVYRLNFLLWRLRVVLNLFLPFFLWSTVFDKNISFGNYQKPTLLSYILYVNIITTLVFASRTSEIASDINDGRIINYLLKPVSFFKFILTKDLADKAINAFFSIIETFIIIKLFSVSLVPPSNLPIFLIFFINGVFISFFINLMLSLIGFWTTETWAPRFIFIVLVFFLSGNYFPLDILPKPIFYLLSLTPFPYLFYLPTKILISSGAIEQWSNGLIYQQLFLSFFWLFAAWRLCLYMWTRGNKSFSFWGR